MQPVVLHIVPEALPKKKKPSSNVTRGLGRGRGRERTGRRGRGRAGRVSARGGGGLGAAPAAWDPSAQGVRECKGPGAPGVLGRV